MVLSVWMKRYPLWKLTITAFSTTVSPKFATTVTYLCPSLSELNSLLAGIYAWDVRSLCQGVVPRKHPLDPLDLLSVISPQTGGAQGGRDSRGEGLRGGISEGKGSEQRVSKGRGLRGEEIKQEGPRRQGCQRGGTQKGGAPRRL